MKTNEELKGTANLLIRQSSADGGKVGHCNLGNYKAEHTGYMKGILLTPNFFCTEHGERKDNG